MSGAAPADGIVDRIRNRLEGPNTYGNSGLFWAVFGIMVLGLALYPLSPTTSAFDVLTTTQYFALAFLALSLSIVWGYTGVLSFGQVAFFGVAAYTFGVIGINFSSAAGVTAAFFGAVIVGAGFAALLGYFMFYGGVRDVYVTIITLVVAMVLNTFMAQTAGSEWAIGEAALGGFNGMTNIPDLTFGVGETALVLDMVGLYYALLVLLVGTYLGLRVLVNSQLGMTMVAVREDEDRTATFGYNVPFIKLVSFTIGGGLAAAGGVFYASWGNFIDPSVFGILFGDRSNDRDRTNAHGTIRRFRPARSRVGVRHRRRPAHGRYPRDARRSRTVARQSGYRTARRPSPRTCRRRNARVSGHGGHCTMRDPSVNANRTASHNNRRSTAVISSE